MLRTFFSAISLIFLASHVAAQAEFPDRRAVVINDMDYYGSDLQPIFDTTYANCRNACLTNQSCNAFTYNTKSSACFPKSDVTEEVAYEGAYSRHGPAGSGERRGAGRGSRLCRRLHDPKRT